MKRRLISIEVLEDGTVFTQAPAREFTEAEEDDTGAWEPWEQQPSIDEALDVARQFLTKSESE